MRLSVFRTATFKTCVPAISTVLFVVSFACYLVTLCPGVYWYDSGELQGAVPTLGLPHSPSFPSYILSSHFFWWLPFGDMAFRINAGTALNGALVSVLTFLLALKLFGSTTRANCLTALFTGLAVSMNPLFWFQNMKAEVYSLNSAWLLIVLILCVDSIDSHGNRRRIVRNMWLAALFLGLAGANHSLLTAHVFPAAFIALLLVIRKVTWKDILIAVNIAVLALSTYLYLPLRAVKNPIINIGNPENSMNFVNAVTRRGSYDRFLGNTFDIWLKNWLEYVSLMKEHFSAIFILLSVIGLLILLFQRFKPSLILVIASLTNVSVSLINRNFNLNPDTGPAYLMISTIILVIGFGGFFRELIRLLDKHKHYQTASALLITGMFLIPVAWSYETLKTGGLRHETSAAYAGKAILDILPEDSILVYGMYFNLPFVTSYLQAVEHHRRDVIGINRAEIVYWPGGLQRLSKTYPWLTKALYSGHNADTFDYLAPRSARHSRKLPYEDARNLLFNAVAWIAQDHAAEHPVFWFSSEDDHLLRIQVHPHGPMLKLGEPITGSDILVDTHSMVARRVQRDDAANFGTTRGANALSVFYDLQCMTLVQQKSFSSAESARNRSVIYDPYNIGFCTHIDFAK